jgi:hypothetical protein
MDDWSAVYAEVAAASALRPCPDLGLDWRNVTMMFNTVVVEFRHGITSKGK